MKVFDYINAILLEEKHTPGGTPSDRNLLGTFLTGKMTRRLDMYAKEIAMAAQPDYKPQIIRES
ncbi:hypothetical protein Tcan_17868 [Toxocara canis]|uniref:Uncharacterized protein n=1 Tax=Toxocara canis TaxID=6265 RepID=A0A0B2UWR4_TOXCA|nr:hypothetical protein Tcan_17868 [Toxocara canis]